MGALTQTMTRLRDEINSAGRSRQASREDRVRQAAERRSQVLALCAGFARDRAGAQRAWLGGTSAERATAGKEKQRLPLPPAQAIARAEHTPPASMQRNPLHVAASTRQVAPTAKVRPAVPAQPAAKHPIKSAKRS